MMSANSQFICLVDVRTEIWMTEQVLYKKDQVIPYNEWVGITRDIRDNCFIIADTESEELITYNE